MPFGFFQTIVSFLLVLLVFAWQWLPHQIFPFSVCALAAALSLAPRPGFLSSLMPWMAALLWFGLLALLESHTAAEFLQAAGAGLILIFWWRRRDVGDYLAVLVIAVVNFFLTLVLRRPPTVWHWGLVPLAVMLVVVYAHLVRMRYDMETHTIVKHRLGRQSRRVDVARLLQSRRALDIPVVAMMLAVGALTAALSMGIVLASAPLLGKLHLNLSSSGDFPGQLDLARMGRPVVDGHAQLFVFPEPQSLTERYWRGQVYDRLEKGVWFRRPFAPAAFASGACTEYVVRRENPALTDGFAPLGVVWAAGMDGRALAVSDDGRVRVPSGMREYRVCAAAQSVSRNPAPKRPHLKVSAWVLHLAQAVVHESDDFDTTLQRVLQFLAKYDYSDAYPHVLEGRDPLVHFLFFTRSGPCGLFASAAAIFLDRAGIPVRLVTGFSPGEKEKNGLRLTSEHAHSWLEAWHPERGWIIVDPTQAARQKARHFGVSNAATVAIMLGFALVLVLFGGAIGFWWRRGSRQTSTEKTGRTVHYEGRISQTKLEAQMLFHEWLSGADFASMPRQPGENARDYALRLEAAGHPRAHDVRDAASWAARVLFAPISDEEKIMLLQKLRSLFLVKLSNDEKKEKRDGTETINQS